MDIGNSYKNIKAEVKTLLGKILVRFLIIKKYPET